MRTSASASCVLSVPSRVLTEILTGGKSDGRRAILLAGHCRHRAAQIQVDLLVAQLRQFLHCPQRLIRLVGEHLRHQRHSGVVLRSHVPLFLCLEMLRIVGRHKGRVVSVRPREEFVVRVSVHVPGDPLQRGKIVFHAILILQFMFTKCPPATIIDTLGRRVGIGRRDRLKICCP